tara:strand:- start:272 stop:406 length:135 start_codon:yes stop_codon:yes gene_type:complete
MRFFFFHFFCNFFGSEGKGILYAEFCSKKKKKKISRPLLILPLD